MQKRINKARVIAAAGAAVFSSMSLFSAIAPAASFTWTGTTDANLSGVNTNWSPNGAPGGADVTVFALSSQLAPQVNANVAWLSMTFNSDAGAYTFGGAGSILLGNTTPAGGAIINNSAQTQTFNVPMAFRIGALNAAAGNLTFTNTFNIGNNPNNNAGRNMTIDGAFTTTISGQITGTTAASTAAPAEGTNWGQLIKNGSGTLILSNDTSNLTYTGRITVNSGVIQVQAANALGANGQVVVGANTITAGTTHVGGGTNTGRLELVNNITYAAETLSLEARSVTDTQLSNLNGNNTWTGAVSLLTGGGTYSISSEAGLLTIAGNVTNNTASTAARTMVLRGASNGVISGNIVEAGVSANLGISKEGAGVWTLSGANTYSGTTNISGGTLAIGAGGATGSLGGGTVTNDANLVFNRNAPMTVTNAISGAGNVFHAGSTTTTLSGALSYTGSTTVQSGTLAISTAKTGGGAVSVNDGAALTLNSASTTTTMTASTFTTGSTGAGGAVLNFSLGTSGNPTVPLISATSLVKNGMTTVNLSGSNLSIGTITLAQYAGQSGSGGFALGSLPARVLATLFNNPTKLDLNITGLDFPKWTGAVNGNWDTTVNANPKNWKLNSNNAPTDYLQGDSVLFDNSTAVNTVNITTTVSPNAIAVANDAAHNYTFQGPGTITGLASLTKTGAGTLTIANDGVNDFSGPISIGTGGALAIGNGGTSGSVGAGAITDNGLLALNRSDGGTLGNTVSGSGALVATSGATWTLSANNGYAGTTTINGGTLQVGTGGAAGSVGAGDIAVAAGATFAVNRSGTVTLNQQITGSGDLSKNGSSILVLGGNNSFGGAVNLNLGVLRATNSNAFGTNAKMIVVDTRTKGIELDGGVSIPSNVTMRISGDGDVAQGATVNSALHSLTGTNAVAGQIQLGVGGGNPFIRVDAGGTLKLNGDVTVVPGASTNGRTLTLTGAGSGEVNGVISDGSGAPGDFLSVSLNGTGAPSWTFTRDNTFSGSISMQSGTLTANANGALGANMGTFTFIGNGGAGFAGIPAALKIGANGVVVPNQLWTNKDGAGLGANQNRTIGYSLNSGTGTFSGSVDLNGGVVLRAPTGGTLVMSGVLRDGTDVSAGVKRDVFVNAGGQVVLSNANTYTGQTQVDAGTLVAANLQALSTGTIIVNSGGTLSLRPGLGGAVKNSVLAINGTGVVDMTDNDMILTATPANTVFTYLQTGYNFGGHDGVGGILSSTARNNPNGNTTLGMLTGDEYLNNNGDPNFDGIPVAGTDVLIKYTYFGDVDFNGQIDVSDYNLIDFGFVNHLTGWANGDADYSGAVDASDYNVIDFAFTSQSGMLRRAISYLDGSDRSTNGMSDPSLQKVIDHYAQFGDSYAAGFLAHVPEPTTGAALLVLATSSLRRRRRR